MRAKQCQFGTAHNDVGLFEVGSACTDGLDLPAFQYQSCLELLLDEEVVKGFAIVDNAHGVPS